MLDRPLLLILLAAAVLVAVGGVVFWLKAPASQVLREVYATPRPAPEEGGLRVFHLGHSLVGRDMPAMLAQLAGKGHGYESQLGWGTTLKQHWRPDAPIKGFEEENDHPRFRHAREAVGSGDYDAVVLTEMVEIRDAIRYFDSGTYFAKWAALARQANPGAQVFLYETWHQLDDPDGWLKRLDRDLERYWIDRILLADLRRNSPARPAYLIPAGQVMAAFVRKLEARGGLGGLTSRADLFRLKENGEVDPIHINDLGEYLVALTHYAVIYRATPVGLPWRLKRADGRPARAPAPEVARLMQETVWQVVRAHPETGVPK